MKSTCYMFLFIGILQLTIAGHSATFTEQELRTFSQQHQVNIALLKQAINQAQLNQDVLNAMRTPHEAKPWFAYYPLFINQKRIQAAIHFGKKHQQTLQRAQKRFHIPPAIILAILSIETSLGKYTGSYRVLDALYTLAFHFPSRADFFQKEFAAYLTLSQRQNWSLSMPLGSYAGAMGMAQFMPSNYQKYAIDFSQPQDEKIDLYQSVEDAIGSIGHYLHQHGWQANQPICAPLATASTQKQAPIKPITNTSEKLIKLIHPENTEYWLTYHNFDVIMTYNPRINYAMAVYQLSEKIAAQQVTN